MPGLDIQGFASPFRFGPRGHANRVKGLKRIKENIVGIALTRLGERIREREIGTIGYSLVMRNPTPSAMTLVVGLTKEAITVWEPRVILRHVTWLRQSVDSGSHTFIKVFYELRDFRDEDQVAEFKIGDR